jgi:hypothetical protein
MRIFRFSTLYVLAGLGLGIFTGLRALDSTGLENVKGGNGWQEWRLSESDRLLPYSLGHFLSAGQVPPPRATHFYVRYTDDDGNILSSDCIFKIDGPAIAARWWSLRAGDEVQSTLSAGQAVLTASGQLDAVISRHPMPGNWILPTSSGTYVLSYVISEPAKAKDATALILPSVKRVGCI